MGKSDKGLRVIAAPHLKVSRSTQVLIWGLSGSLLPICITSVVFFGWNAVQILFVAIGSALLFEWLFHFKTHQRINILVPNTILLSVLFALLLPPLTPSWLVALGSFVVVFLAYKAFGGLGQNLFHPALVGYLLLANLFPAQVVAQNAAISSRGVLAIVIGGGIAIAARWVRWEVVLVYLAAGMIGSHVFGTFSEFFDTNFLFCAFFIVTDTVTSPVTREGRMIFAMGAGILAALFQLWTSNLQAITSAILLMNGLAPLMDQPRKFGVRSVNYG